MAYISYDMICVKLWRRQRPPWNGNANLIMSPSPSYIKTIQQMTREEVASVESVVEKKITAKNGDVCVIRTFFFHNKIKAFDIKGKRLGVYRHIQVTDTDISYADRVRALRNNLEVEKKIAGEPDNIIGRN